jgi:hypothetical protein
VSAARRIDETKLRRELGRVLAPALAAKVVEASVIAEDEPVTTPKQPTPEALERARARGRAAAKR